MIAEQRSPHSIEPLSKVRQGQRTNTFCQFTSFDLHLLHSDHGGANRHVQRVGCELRHIGLPLLVAVRHDCQSTVDAAGPRRFAAATLASS